MNFVKTAMALMVGVALSTEFVAAQGGPAAAHPKKNKTSFVQNKEDTSVKIDPAFEKQLRAVIPFDDTTRQFYPSARQTNVFYSTPLEESQSMDIHNELIKDRVSLVRETITAGGLPQGENGRPEGEGKIFAVHVAQEYEKNKAGQIHSPGEGTSSEVVIFINTGEGARIVTLNDQHARVEDYLLNPKDHMSFMKRVADGKLDAKEYLADNEIAPALTTNYEPDPGKDGPLGFTLHQNGSAVRNIKNDQPTNIQNLFKFKQP